jgi:hypothetical protein
MRVRRRSIARPVAVLEHADAVVLHHDAIQLRVRESRVPFHLPILSAGRPPAEADGMKRLLLVVILLLTSACTDDSSGDPVLQDQVQPGEE